MEEIRFDKILWGSLGRNGYVHVTGIDIDAYDKIVRLTPINTRGLRTKCFIELPKDKIDELIDKLNKLK